LRSDWPSLLECKLKATNDRAQEELCNLVRIATLFSAVNTTVASAASACACVVRVAASATTFIMIERACKNATLVNACLNAIRADVIQRIHPSCTPVPWRKCLLHALLSSRKPTLVAYLKDWVHANPCDEAHMHAALLDA
jgi:hypothetical protein